MFRPDITVMVNWALGIILYLSDVLLHFVVLHSVAVYCIVTFRPDLTVMVNWALGINNISLYHIVIVFHCVAVHFIVSHCIASYYSVVYFIVLHFTCLSPRLMEKLVYLTVLHCMCLSPD